DQHLVQRRVHLVGGGSLWYARIFQRPNYIAELWTAAFIDDHVARNGEQPGARRALGVADHLGMLPGPQQRLLHHVLGTTGVAGQPKRITPQRSSVLVIKRLHQRGFAVVGTGESTHSISPPDMRYDLRTP